jgi:hypothetical protein
MCLCVLQEKPYISNQKRQTHYFMDGVLGLSEDKKVKRQKLALPLPFSSLLFLLVVGFF